MRLKTFILYLVFFIYCNICFAQKNDTLHVDTTGKINTSKIKGKSKDSLNIYNPGIAIKRSAVLPGWGQYTNKKYWKIPIIYGGLGATGYLFFRNMKQYKEAKKAYILATDLNPANDDQIKEPYYSVRMEPQRIQAFRNSVRQNVDYSALFFVLIWGVQVADAAVDAHLKTFDVSDDLSFHFKVGYSNMANTAGVSLVMHIR
jgi:hypothetical protein